MTATSQRVRLGAWSRWKTLLHPPSTLNRWAFVKPNRADPDPDAQQRAEAMDGSYTFWYEMSAFTAGGTHPASAGGAESDCQGCEHDGRARSERYFLPPRWLVPAAPPPRAHAPVIPSSLPSSRTCLANGAMPFS